MHLQGEFRERVLQSLIFVTACMAVLAISGFGVFRMANQASLEQQQGLKDAAISYAMEIQRLLDIYTTSSLDLAAFAGASPDLSNRSFQQFVEASSPFERLPGLSSLGYLPRVSNGKQFVFEAKTRSEFPGFRVWNRRFYADESYPLLYGVNKRNPGRISQLRGFDFSSIVEREEAMLAAERLGRPQSTYMHHALMDRLDSSVVLLFTPVSAASGTAGASGGQVPEPGAYAGFVFSVLFVDELFASFDAGPVRRKFDLEVFETTTNQSSLIYNGSGNVASLQPDHNEPPVHSGTLKFAGQTWAYFIYGMSSGVFPTLMASLGGYIAAGFLASLVAGYIAVRVRRHYRELARAAWHSENFATFFEAHPFTVYSLDRKRRITAVNAQAEKEFAKPRHMLVGQSLDNFLDEGSVEISRVYFSQALSGSTVSYYNRVRLGDGADYDFSVVLVPVSVDGKVNSVLGIVTNVTQKRRAEEELFRSRQMLQLVLDHIPQMVFWKGADGRYLGANRRTLEFGGLSGLHQIIGKTDDDLPWKGHALEYREQDRQVIHRRQPLLKHQEVQQHINGSCRWIEVSKIPMITSDGTVDCVLGVVDDISARKDIDEELFRRANSGSTF